MLYQFMDWRHRRGRQIYVVEVDKLHDKFGKKLPPKLSSWEDYQNFAGAAGITLPEKHEAAKAVFPYNPDYPTLDWLGEEYVKMLHYVSVENPKLAKELGIKEEKEKEPPPHEPPAQPAQPKK